MTVTIRTYVTNGINTTSPTFNIGFTPTIFSFSDKKFYGPSNSITGTVWTEIPSTVTALSPSPTVKNPDYAPIVDFTVNKLDQNNNPLAGAVFTLTGPNTYTSGTSGSDGKALFKSVLAGSYTLTETTVPSGYTGVQPQTVVISSTSTSVNITNTLIPYLIKIDSKDQGGNGIVGAVYEVTNTTTGTLVGSFTTGTGGTVTTSQLIAGNNYSVKQVSVPAGYTATAVTPQVITGLVSGTTTLTFNNLVNTTTNLTINLKKTNTTTNLAGGIFEIWTTGASPVKVATSAATDTNGNVTISNILNGKTYEVRQVTAPSGYSVAGSQTLDLTGVTTNSTKAIQFYNSDFILNINLKDSTNNTKNLSGGVFVAKFNGTQIGNAVTTDTNGNATITGLASGNTYTIEEVTPPVGYMPMTPQTVSISTNITIRTLH